MAAALIGWACGGAADAAWVQPIGVQASSWYNTSYLPINVINGSGLSDEAPGATHADVLTNQWHSSAGVNNTGAGTVSEQYLTFTLPGVFDLDTLHVWQFSQSGNQARGVNEFTLEVSSDGNHWNTVTFTTGSTLEVSTGGAMPAQTKQFADTAADIRFVRFNIDSNHAGNASGFTGLAEIRFEGTQSSGVSLLRETGAGPADLSKTASSNDLLQGITAQSTALGSGSVSRLTDGLAPASTTAPDDNRVIGANTVPWVLTFDLAAEHNHAVNINEVNVYSYNTDNRRAVDFDLEYSTDGGATWQYAFIGATNNDLTTGNYRLMSLIADDGEFFIEGASDLRFTFRTPYGGALQSSLIEIDVFGVVVPEPSTWMLTALGAGGVGLLLRRRRRSL